MKLEYTDTANNDSREITAYTNNYQRSDNIDTLGEEFTFNLVSNNLDVNMKDLKLGIGGKVTFYNDIANNNRTSSNDSSTDTTMKPIFQGIIVEEKQSGISAFGYTCYDYAFYLNKSEVMIQFNDEDGTSALRRLCAENNVPLGSVPQIATKIKKVYQGQVISKIIQDILKQDSDLTGRQYRLELREGKVFIEDYKNLMLDVAITGLISEYSRTESMADMKNQVIVISSKEKHMSVEAIAKDDEKIKKFGLLQKIEKVDDKKKGQTANIAANKLKELSKVKKSFSVKVLGDDTVRSGRTLHFEQALVGFTGDFLIKNCKHNYSANHTMTLELEKVDTEEKKEGSNQ